MEAIKNIAAVLGVILSAASVITLLSKTVRQCILSLFRRYGKTDEVSEDIGEIKRLLEQHIADDEKFRDNVSAINDVMIEFTRTQCRTIIKNIFYKYNETKILPLYEKKTLMCVEDLYVNKTHGNSFAKLLLDEMSTWTVDYESSHPDEDDH